MLPKAGHPLALLPILPLNGVGARRLLQGLLVLRWGLLRAAELVLRTRPAAVLGIGGYAGGPLVLVAALLGVRTVILEPNAKPGFTNRVLRPLVGASACAYQEACREIGPKGVLTGNPVRGGFARLEPKPHAAPYALLVFGGSQGAASLNAAMQEALAGLLGSGMQIVWLTGRSAFEGIMAGVSTRGEQLRIYPYLEQMEQGYAVADLAVCRAGATTIAELTCAGIPSILVPYPHAAADHQTENAKSVAEGGGALMVLDSEIQHRLLGEVTSLLNNAERLLLDQGPVGLRSLLYPADPYGRQHDRDHEDDFDVHRPCPGQDDERHERAVHLSRRLAAGRPFALHHPEQRPVDLPADLREEDHRRVQGVTMQDRTHTRFHSAPAVIRAGAFLFPALCLLSLPRPAPADTVSLGAGPGCYRFSHDSEAVLLRYEHDAAPLFNREGFWAGTFAAWSGENHAEAIGLSRGMRWPFGDSWHADAELGLNWVSDTTENLGTPIQMLLRAAVGRRFDSLDVSLGVLHYSNA